MKILDEQGLQYLWKQISLEDYPNNETLIAVLNAIDETKADKDEAKPADFVANITKTYVVGTGYVYSCDKTFEEMWAAHEAGMDIIFEANGSQIKAHEVAPTYISAINIEKGNNFTWYHIKSDGTIEGDGTGLITKRSVQQETGTSKMLPMSQKATTDALALKADANHNHNDLYYTIEQIDAYDFITVDDIDENCGSVTEGGLPQSDIDELMAQLG